MIDLHTHILYGVDDGAASLEESLKCIEACYLQGVRGIFLTPHRKKGQFESSSEKRKAHFACLQAETRNRFPELQLFYGEEIYVSFDALKKVEEGEWKSLANGSFVLIEFHPALQYAEIEQAVVQVRCMGKYPVLAHIERYEQLAFDAGRVERLIQKGAYTQVNAKNVLPMKIWGEKHKMYKKRVKFFLEKQLVHFVASDLHAFSEENLCLFKAYQQIEKKYGKERADLLFSKNQEALLQKKEEAIRL